MRVLEHVVRRASLAVRLTDLATGEPVRDGVTVTAWPAARPDLASATRAVSAAGIAGFTQLPGLRAYEDGSTRRADWFASPLVHPPQPFVVRVEDVTGAHLRVVREVVAPVAGPIGVALPRSPSAGAPSGSLAVVAQLVDRAGDPAAWALVELRIGATVTGGVADARGAVVIPVPRAVPPTAPGTPAQGPVWQVRVRARYRPADQVLAPGTRRPEDPPTSTSVLTQAPCLLDDAGSLVGELVRDLTAAEPLVLVSSPPPATSVLVVRPTP